MATWALFTDGSAHPPSRIGYGAYFATPVTDLTVVPTAAHICVQRFTDTTAAKLELQTLLWALDELGNRATRATLYTDSQTLVALPRRRERLEQAQYQSRAGKPLNQHALYRDFFAALDRWQFALHKVPGHQPAANHSPLTRIFAQVDRAARKALRPSANPSRL